MIPSMSARKRKSFAVWMMLACLAMPAVSRADEPAIPDHDARVDGYPTNMVLDAGGTATSYILLFLLGAVGLGVTFLASKRSHLD